MHMNVLCSLTFHSIFPKHIISQKQRTCFLRFYLMPIQFIFVKGHISQLVIPTPMHGQRAYLLFPSGILNGYRCWRNGEIALGSKAKLILHCLVTHSDITCLTQPSFTTKRDGSDYTCWAILDFPVFQNRQFFVENSELDKFGMNLFKYLNI